MSAAARRRLAIGLIASLATLGALLIAPASSIAMSIEVLYEAVDLPDAIAGVDEWAYRYTVVGFDSNTANGLSIFFDSDSTSALKLGTVAPPPAWDILVLQPDALLPADGFVDALALTQPATSSGPIDVEFIWSGLGVPGAQTFALYDESFAHIASGITSAVPEPSTALLVSAGLAGLAATRRSTWR